MDKFVSIWWPSEDDAAAGGDGAKGFKTLNWHAVGTDFPAIARHQEIVVDTGKSQTPTDKTSRQVLYNRGVYNSMLIAEASATRRRSPARRSSPARTCAAASKRSMSTPRASRRSGLERLRRRRSSCPAPTTTATAPTFVQQWDGTKWVKIGDRIAPMTDKVKPLLDAAAKDYAEKNAGWPKRTEACDNES